jgi:DNA-binding transcriptional ArsR family regulator
VSKHLRVLRQVGLVQARDEGRQRVYRVDGRPLKQIHDWLSDYAQLWTERLDLMDEVVQELKEAEDGDHDE